MIDRSARWVNSHFGGCWWPTELNIWEATIPAQVMCDEGVRCGTAMAGISSAASGWWCHPGWPSHGRSMTAAWKAWLGQGGSGKKVSQYPKATAVAVKSVFSEPSPAQRPRGRYQSLGNGPSFVPPPLFYSRYSMEE